MHLPVAGDDGGSAHNGENEGGLNLNSRITGGETLKGVRNLTFKASKGQLCLVSNAHGFHLKSAEEGILSDDESFGKRGSRTGAFAPRRDALLGVPWAQF